MRDPGLFTAHVIGDSWLHRAAFGAKLIGVIAIGLLPWFVRTPLPLALVLAALLVVAATARVPLSRLLRSLRSLAPVLLVLGAFQWWAVGPAYAARIVLGITTAFVAAGLLTATTTVRSASRFSTTRTAPSSAARATMSVPCWSSWNTGMSSRALSRRSISKHRGAEMSSRLMPP